MPLVASGLIAVLLVALPVITLTLVVRMIRLLLMDSVASVALDGILVFPDPGCPPDHVLVGAVIVRFGWRDIVAAVIFDVVWMVIRVA